MKKMVISALGGVLVLIGAVFLVIPGPGLLFILPGLLILSYEYHWAEPWLRKSMKVMSSASRALDKFISNRKNSRYY